MQRSYSTMSAQGWGLKEETEFKRHVELEVVSETREAFVRGDLFDLGDTVVIKETDEVGDTHTSR